jgi:hypothetical protein
MLVLTILGFLCSAASALSPLQNPDSSDPQCTTACAGPVNVSTTCVTSADSFCGCSDFVSTAPGCSDCLVSKNITLLGFINPPYLAFIVAVCKCQIPTCGDLTLVEKQCQITNPNDTTCACPATLKDAPECYKCLEANEPSLAEPLGQRVAQCNSSANTTTGTTSTASSLPTFTSDSSIVSVFRAVWLGLGMLTVMGIALM